MFGLLLALAATAATTGQIASTLAVEKEVSARQNARSATALLKRLDLNSFPNSTGPRRQRALHTPSDYGFVDLKSFDDGWAQISEPDDGWHISALLLASGDGKATICFVDAGGNGATYRETKVLSLIRGAAGRLTATQVADRKECQNSPRQSIGRRPN